MIKNLNILTGHHGKYALAKHAWTYPLDNIYNNAKKENLPLLTPKIKFDFCRNRSATAHIKFYFPKNQSATAFVKSYKGCFSNVAEILKKNAL